MWALRKDYRKLSPGQRGSLAVIVAPYAIAIGERLPCHDIN
jgi:hypothetical protein